MQPDKKDFQFDTEKALSLLKVLLTSCKKMSDVKDGLNNSDLFNFKFDDQLFEIFMDTAIRHFEDIGEEIMVPGGIRIN